MRLYRSPARCQCPVTVWHPEDDTTTPPLIARLLGEELPRATVRTVPGAGHLWHVEHLGEVLAEAVCSA